MMLLIDQISFSYEKTSLLHDVSFSMASGEIVTLIGASGSGKTTLFKLVTGLEIPQKGLITIGSQQQPAAHAEVAYMMQEDLLLPWRSILSNLILPSELGKHKQSREVVEAEALELLKEMELSHCAEMFPEQLSSGMRQRVSLARALMQRRPLLLLDEPFSALDVALREHMYDILRGINKRYGTTILMVTHDFRDALSLSDRILLMSQGTIAHEWQVPDAKREDPYFIGLLLEEMRKKIKQASW